MSDNTHFDFSIIRTLRLKRGFTAEHLAEKAGLTRATIAKIEGGEGNPTLDTIRTLSNVFQLSASELIRLAEVDQCEQAEITSFRDKGMDVDHIFFPGFEIFHIRGCAGLHYTANPEFHENTAEVCLILSGRIRVKIAGQIYEMGSGMVMRFKALQEHEFEIIEDADFLMMHHDLM
ncbi:helix-turn-helix domain-containing protein [Desulfobulbus rhabdoformis]|uniref:helix-turn-helix transcriptional regulator n=1 Tax=Desulfobulbus rhabdoformis TaxID=34032 RepID=UPI001963C870|nr:helix-turn-helix transcriptional regulator [Desulfobulbus rhabdoformis]MBM9616172.1 helix-turn-helix domain-containing protein [Desulfobulbus rhabdoformis]